MEPGSALALMATWIQVSPVRLKTSAWSRTSSLTPNSRGSIRDGKVLGLGISNMKGGIAAFMMAGKALKKSAILLKGDLVLAAVVGEISRTPVGPWQTKEYRGEGAGTRHLLTHGMHTDYAVVADGSDMNIVWTQTGVVQMKIATFGRAEAAWGTKRATHPMEQLNAIVKMTRIIEALENWAKFLKRTIFTTRRRAQFIPRSILARSKAGRRTVPIIFPAFAAFTLTCACRRR